MNDRLAQSLGTGLQSITSYAENHIRLGTMYMSGHRDKWTPAEKRANLSFPTFAVRAVARGPPDCHSSSVCHSTTLRYPLSDLTLPR